MGGVAGWNREPIDDMFGGNFLYITDDRLQAQANNLTLVRLVLASAVIWTHSYWRVTGIGEQDELSRWLGTTISAYAVDAFFFLSGFLVYRSLAQRGSVADFALARLARLWPALAASVGLTIIGGYFVSGLPISSYLAGDTLRFAYRNLSLLTGHYNLTGVRCSNGPCVVNGSLWTIPWEVRCYALLALLGLAGLASPRRMAQLVLPISASAALLLHVPGMATLIEQILGPGVLYNVVMVDRLWTMFALGIAAYIWRDRLYLNWWVLAGLCGMNLAAQYSNIHFHLQALFVGYAVLCFGFLSVQRTALSGNWPDYSYGMYIYAFPVMMLLAGGFNYLHHGWLALANFLVTLPIAALSWHLLEEPVLGQVRSRRQRQGKRAASAITP